MNNDDRKQLDKAYALIDEAKAIIEQVGADEQDKFDNLSEGLQAAERGQRMDEVATMLSSLADTLDEALTEIDEAKG